MTAESAKNNDRIIFRSTSLANNTWRKKIWTVHLEPCSQPSSRDIPPSALTQTRGWAWTAVRESREESYLPYMQGIKVSAYAFGSTTHCFFFESMKVPNSLQPHEHFLLCPWSSPGSNTGVGCHFLLQGIFPTRRPEPWTPPPQADSLLSELQGSPLGLYWTRRQRNPFFHFKAPRPPQWVPGGFCEVWLPLCQSSCFMSLLILGILRKTVPSGLLGSPCVRRSRSEFLEVLEIWA